MRSHASTARDHDPRDSARARAWGSSPAYRVNGATPPASRKPRLRLRGAGQGCASRPPACVCAVRSRDRAVPGLFARYASGDVIVARAFTGDVAQTLPLRLCLAITVEYTARFVPA